MNTSGSGQDNYPTNSSRISRRKIYLRNIKLRTEVVLIFIGAFFILGCVMAGEFLLSKQLADSRVHQVALTGQKSTWKKVIGSTYQQMLFYAYDANPGKPSIWRLRGKRSPVDSIVSGNAKRIQRAILPLYKNLLNDEIVDILLVFDPQASLLFLAKDKDTINESDLKNNVYRQNLLDVIESTKAQKMSSNQIADINKILYATVSFPIFSNARVAGIVIYGRKIQPLIEDLANNTKTFVFVNHPKSKKIYSTNEKLNSVALRKNNNIYNIISKEKKTYFASSFDMKLLNGKTTLTFLSDITAEHKRQNKYYFITAFLVIALALILTGLTNYLLRHRFKPLDKAINVLNALAKGDTSVKMKTAGNNEVGRIAQTVNSFRESLIEREKIRGLFGKYIPEAVAEKMLEKDGGLEPQLTEATIFFIDLAGFTAMAEKISPGELVSILNEYFSEIVAIIEEHKGIIAQFQGDALLAMFNVPVADSDHAANAIQAGIKIDLLVKSKLFGNKNLNCRIGINTGEVVAGNIGAEDRLSYTVYGDAVNLAARLEQMNKETGTTILVSASTASLISDVKFNEIGDVSVRGKTEKVKVFSLKNEA